MELNAELLFPVDAKALMFARNFWRIVEQTYPELMPGKYGNTEPLSNEVIDDDINPMLGSPWQDDHMLIWQPKNIKAEGTWWMSNGRDHSVVKVYGKPGQFNIVKLQELWHEVVTNSYVDLGHIHLLTEDEFKATRRWHHQMYTPFNAGFSIMKLKKHLPNLAWGMFFGKPYVDLIGLEKLESAPAAVVQQWKDGVYLQVTEDILDVARDYSGFDRGRTEIKEHLGRQYFFDPTSAIEKYEAPQFKFEYVVPKSS